MNKLTARFWGMAIAILLLFEVWLGVYPHLSNKKMLLVMGIVLFVSFFLNLCYGLFSILSQKKREDEQD